MITMYINKKAIDKNMKFINAIDLTFDKVIYQMDIKDNDRKAIEDIDNAYYEGNGYIVTPFGRTEIQNLSTGCKTLIILNHSKELGNPIVNIGECGKNVLDVIFDMDNIQVYLDYCSIPNEYDHKKEITVVSVNGRRLMKLEDAFNKVWRKR